MKALSLLQPWASLIAVGAKKIETRSWSTKYRGPLAIHASKKLLKDNDDLCYEEPFKSALKGFYPFSLGIVVATCDLVDCIKMTPEFIQSIQSPELDFGVYAVGRCAWILENIKPLEKPIPASGALSLWEWEAEHA